MTDITALMATMKSAAEKATRGDWTVQFGDEIYAVDGVNNDQVAVATLDANDADHIALSNPVNVLALVEALEKAQRNENLTEAERQAYLGLIRDRDARIAELEKAASEPVAWTNEESLSGVGIDMCGMLGPKNAVGDIALYTVSPSMESSTVTVKLPPRVDSSNVPFTAHTWNCCLDAVEKCLTAAGIQVIEGEGQ